MNNNSKNNKFPNKYQQSATANKWSAQKKQVANIDEEPNPLKGCLIHFCGFFGICSLLAGIVSDGEKISVLLIPILKAILFLFWGNQTLCLIVGVVLLLIYGVCYLLYKDIYFKKD